MKKLLFNLVSVLALIPLAHGQSTKISFSNDMHQYKDGIVRIISQDDQDSGQGLQSEPVTLDDGTKIDSLDWGSGTGFLINKDGYIVTNNHVIGVTAESHDSEKFLMVVENVGGRYFAHKAKVVWQSPENDVAVLQCTNMHGTPLPLDLSEPKLGDNVATMGYPAQQDTTAMDTGVAEHLKPLILQRLVDNQVRAMVAEAQKTNPKITDVSDDVKQSIAQEQDSQALEIAKSYNFNACLAAIGSSINSTWNQQDIWDITDVVNRNALWSDFFNSTDGYGKIEKVSHTKSYTGEGDLEVPIISHNVDMKHGNSGGPLLSSNGGVLAVVGRGDVDQDAEKRFDATQVVQLLDWLKSDSSRHYQTLFYIPQRTMLLVGLGVLALAIGFVFLSLQSHNAAPVLARGGSQDGGGLVLPLPKDRQGSGAELTIVPGKPGSGWVLSGRSGNRNLKVEFNEGLFSRNGGRLIIGRSPELSHLVLETDDVSRQHAQIRKEGGSFFIADRNSSNRTAVNGQFTGAPFTEVSLREGDTLTFGEAKVEFRRA